ncbi:MAG: methionine synthase [Chloroflexi bacterium]|nr:methionine synthase [Chloroflexota bacterium]
MTTASGFQPLCLPTAVGSMPQADPQQALRMVLRFLPQIPAWPQLPRRSFTENMYVQFSEGFPGFVVEDDRFSVSSSAEASLEPLYRAYLEDNFRAWRVTPEYAAGLYPFLDAVKGAGGNVPRLASKGQMTGPISWGLTVTDENKRPLLYNDTLADALAKHLHLKARWQHSVLAGTSPFCIVTVDEPFMSAYGSAFVSLTREKVVSLLEEVFSGIKGDLKGLHCCGNTDWSVLLGTTADILNPDVYNYAQSFNLYPEEIKAFLQRDGIVAWGIVPTDENSLKKETVSSLRDRLEEAIAPLPRKGIPFRPLLERSLVTPSCGLSSLSIEACELALETLSGLSRELRRKYLGLASSQ